MKEVRTIQREFTICDTCEEVIEDQLVPHSCLKCGHDFCDECCRTEAVLFPTLASIRSDEWDDCEEYCEGCYCRSCELVLSEGGDSLYDLYLEEKQIWSDWNVIRAEWDRAINGIRYQIESKWTEMREKRNANAEASSQKTTETLEETDS